MVNKYSVRVSDGRHVFLENVTKRVLSEGKKLKRLKLKEQEILQLNCDEFLFIWYEEFCTRGDLPKWINIAEVLYFEIVLD